jgi:hypothetical protein
MSPLRSGIPRAKWPKSMPATSEGRMAKAAAKVPGLISVRKIVRSTSRPETSSSRMAPTQEKLERTRLTALVRKRL